jgi:hypothetical protein
MEQMDRSCGILHLLYRQWQKEVPFFNQGLAHEDAIKPLLEKSYEFLDICQVYFANSRLETIPNILKKVIVKSRRVLGLFLLAHKDILSLTVQQRV